MQMPIRIGFQDGFLETFQEKKVVFSELENSVAEFLDTCQSLGWLREVELGGIFDLFVSALSDFPVSEARFGLREFLKTRGTYERIGPQGVLERIWEKRNEEFFDKTTPELQEEGKEFTEFFLSALEKRGLSLQKLVELGEEKRNRVFEEIQGQFAKGGKKC